MSHNTKQKKKITSHWNVKHINDSPCRKWSPSNEKIHIYFKELTEPLKQSFKSSML